MSTDIGKRYGHLTIVEDTGKRYHGSIVYKCLCDCGNDCIALADSLQDGSTVSCGCVNKENRKNIVNLTEGFIDGTSVTAINGRRKINRNNKSGYNGVSYDSRRKLWVAQLTFQKKKHLIGRFKHKRDAVKARKDAEIIYYGKYRKK